MQDFKIDPRKIFAYGQYKVLLLTESDILLKPGRVLTDNASKSVGSFGISLRQYYVQMTVTYGSHPTHKIRAPELHIIVTMVQAHLESIQLNISAVSDRIHSW